MKRYNPADDSSFSQATVDAAAIVEACINDDTETSAKLFAGTDGDDLELLLAAVINLGSHLALAAGDPVAALHVARDAALQV